MEVRYDLPDFRRCMLPAKRRSGNQIFAHRQSPDDDRVETNLSDEARRDINSVRVVAGDRNSDEFALPVRVRRQLGRADRVESAFVGPCRRADRVKLLVSAFGRKADIGRRWGNVRL